MLIVRRSIDISHGRRTQIKTCTAFPSHTSFPSTRPSCHPLIPSKHDLLCLRLSLGSCHRSPHCPACCRPCAHGQSYRLPQLCSRFLGHPQVSNARLTFCLSSNSLAWQEYFLRSYQAPIARDSLQGRIRVYAQDLREDQGSTPSRLSTPLLIYTSSPILVLRLSCDYLWILR